MVDLYVFPVRVSCFFKIIDIIIIIIIIIIITIVIIVVIIIIIIMKNIYLKNSIFRTFKLLSVRFV